MKFITEMYREVMYTVRIKCSLFSFLTNYSFKKIVMITVVVVVVVVLVIQFRLH